jgi:hypothetical protein
MRQREADGRVVRARAAAQAGATVLDEERYEIVVVERTAPPSANVFVRVNDLWGAPPTSSTPPARSSRTLPTGTPS